MIIVNAASDYDDDGCGGFVFIFVSDIFDAFRLAMKFYRFE
jgi:hypothetical protein